MPPAIDRLAFGSERLRVTALDYGVRVQRLDVMLGDGTFRNVVVGFANVEDYLTDTASIGAVVGRFANRIRNGQFRIGASRYQLGCNEGSHHLHGGEGGFANRTWQTEQIPRGARFRLWDAAGRAGYPGNLDVTVDIEVDDLELRYTYRATTDADTIFNPTCHSYFNLAGGGTVLGHTLEVAASSWLPVDADKLPTGELVRTVNTPFDLQSGRELADLINDPLLAASGGFDHCLALVPDTSPAARLATADLAMTVQTSAPGLQVYTANSFAVPHQSICLETQYFPDSPNHPHFPSPLLRAGETFTGTTTYRFETG